MTTRIKISLLTIVVYFIFTNISFAQSNPEVNQKWSEWENTDKNWYLDHVIGSDSKYIYSLLTDHHLNYAIEKIDKQLNIIAHTEIILSTEHKGNTVSSTRTLDYKRYKNQFRNSLFLPQEIVLFFEHRDRINKTINTFSYRVTKANLKTTTATNLFTLNYSNSHKNTYNTTSPSSPEPSGFTYLEEYNSSFITSLDSSKIGFLYQRNISKQEKRKNWFKDPSCVFIIYDTTLNLLHKQEIRVDKDTGYLFDPYDFVLGNDGKLFVYGEQYKTKINDPKIERVYLTSPKNIKPTSKENRKVIVFFKDNVQTITIDSRNEVFNYFPESSRYKLSYVGRPISTSLLDQFQSLTPNCASTSKHHSGEKHYDMIKMCFKLPKWNQSVIVKEFESIHSGSKIYRTIYVDFLSSNYHSSIWSSQICRLQGAHKYFNSKTLNSVEEDNFNSYSSFIYNNIFCVLTNENTGFYKTKGVIQDVIKKKRTSDLAITMYNQKKEENHQSIFSSNVTSCWAQARDAFQLEDKSILVYCYGIDGKEKSHRYLKITLN